MSNQRVQPKSPPFPAPRRRRFTAERRLEVVEAAANVFIERGYTAAKIDDIVAVIGGSKATLYKQLGGKAELFNTVIREHCIRTTRSLKGEIDASGSPREKLERFATAFLHLILGERSISLLRLVLSISGDFPEVASAYYGSAPESGYKVIADWIVEMQKKRIIREGDAFQMGVVFLDMLTARLQLSHLLRVTKRLPPNVEEATISEALRVFVQSNFI